MKIDLIYNSMHKATRMQLEVFRGDNLEAAHTEEAPSPPPPSETEKRQDGKSMPRSEQAAGSAVDATGGKSTRCTAPGGGTADAPERAIRSAGLRHALSGGVAGAFAKTCTAPLARLVILYQVG
jgi:hypothetical protein